jgi:hypothetical protein
VRALRDEYIKEKGAFERKLKDALDAMDRLRTQKDNAEMRTKEVRLEYEQQVKDLEREVEDTRRQLQVRIFTTYYVLFDSPIHPSIHPSIHSSIHSSIHFFFLSFITIHAGGCYHHLPISID